MVNRGNLGVLVRITYNDSLEKIRSWLPEAEYGAPRSPLLELKPPRRYYTGWGIRSLFWATIPSFIADTWGHAGDDSVIPEPNETSYLNGLRGIASLTVIIQHSTDDYFDFINRGWGETEKDYHLIQLPFIRILTSGTFMVSVFFIISGFALTYGPLKKSHAGRGTDAVNSLPSSLFRRPFRLFIPVIPIVAATGILIHFRAFYLHLSPNTLEPTPGGLWAEVYYLWQSLVGVISLGASTVVPQGWTLAAEYQGSLLVFLCCMALARASAYVRVPIILLLLAYIFNYGVLQQCLFLVGMLIAEARHVRAKLPADLLGGWARATVAAASWYVLILALFFGGFPRHGDGLAAAGYSRFSWIPMGGMSPEHFFHFFSSIALVLALENLPIVQRGLNARWVLYIGEISYSLYLVHWIVCKCPLTKGLTLRLVGAGHSLLFAWAVGFANTMLLSLWLGDIYWRLVDKRSVRFAHWLSDKCGI